MNKLSFHQLLLIFSFIFSSGFISCSEKYEEGKGEGMVNIQSITLSGGISVLKNTNQIQRDTLKVDNGVSLIASLIPVSATSTRSTAQEKFPPGIKYNVVVYNKATGAYVTQRAYISGNEGTSKETLIPLPVAQYTFICYSVGSSTDLPAIDTTQTINNASIAASGEQDLMFFETDASVSATATTYLQVVMRHKFSQVTVSLDSKDIDQIYQISAAMYPQRVGGTLALANGNVTFANDSLTEGAIMNFSPPGDSLASTRIVCTPTTTEARFNISSLTIGANTKTNLSVGPFTIVPEVRYMLDLTVTRCYTFETVGSENIMMNETIESQTKTWNIQGMPDGGFQLDIYSVDNSFNMTINGQPLYIGTYQDKDDSGNTVIRTTNEINFQGWDPGDVVYVDTNGSTNSYGQKGNVYYPPNIKFADNSKWAINDGTKIPYQTLQYDKETQTIPIWEWSYTIKDTTDLTKITPSIRLIVDRDGNVEMYGSKIWNGRLYPLQLVNNTRASQLTGLPLNNANANRDPGAIIVDGKFNPDIRCYSGDNQIIISIMNFGKTEFKGIIHGRKKVYCTP